MREVRTTEGGFIYTHMLGFGLSLRKGRAFRRMSAQLQVLRQQSNLSSNTFSESRSVGCTNLTDDSGIEPSLEHMIIRRIR